MKDNIFLVGFSGIGKTTVGLAYAKANKKNFVSQDYIVERLLGSTLKDYQEKNGPGKLKTAFANVLKELIMACSNTVIDLGGGTSNTDDLKNQTVVFLSGSKELIKKRYEIEDKNDKNRFAKFLSDEEFTEIFNRKNQEYREICNYEVNITENDSIEDVVKKIEELKIG